MIFYSIMVNAWSLAWEALNGTMDETYPKVGAGNTASQYEIDGLDYEVNYYDDFVYANYR